ncbi:hypothetical protein GP5015_1249, partial [gamma proteobacterium HTCC5015]
MLAYLGVDFLVGSLPVIGDAADVVLRVHQKNFQLLAVHV